MEKSRYGQYDTAGLVKAGVVSALYIALTLVFGLLGWAYGPIQFRPSEMLNFLGLHHKRYIYAVTLGVFVANYYQYGVYDMIIGSLSTLIFLWVGRIVGEFMVRKMQRLPFDGQLFRYIVLAVIFTLSMFTTAAMLAYLLPDVGGFWPTFWANYISLMLSEGAMLTAGIFVMYPLSKRINFDE